MGTIPLKYSSIVIFQTQFYLMKCKLGGTIYKLKFLKQMQFVNKLLIVLLLGISTNGKAAEVHDFKNDDAKERSFTAHEMNKLIGVGINIGCTFESSQEKSWSGYWRDDYPEVIKAKGFQSIRLPVRYDNKVGEAPDFKIDPQWMNRIDHVINLILNEGLVCILDFHHINSLNEEPSTENQDMFVKVWEQLSRHYKDYSKKLVFELYNEPHDKMTDEILNSIYKRAYAAIRETNPARVIVMGGNKWNNTNDLINDMWFPENDQYIIGTFHRYKPNEFTHQDEDDNVPFNGTTDEIALAQDMMKEVAEWSEKNDIPVLLGEFGSAKWGGLESRVRWTKAVVEGVRKYDFSMTYWCFNGCTPDGWSIFDPGENEWLNEIVEVILKGSKN